MRYSVDFNDGLHGNYSYDVQADSVLDAACNVMSGNAGYRIKFVTAIAEVVLSRNADNYSPFEWQWCLIVDDSVLNSGLTVTKKDAENEAITVATVSGYGTVTTVD